MQGRVLNPSVVSPPTGTETTLEDQYRNKLDDDDDDNDNTYLLHGAESFLRS